MKKTYFASDQHFGIANSKEREKRFVEWLDIIKEDAEAIYLLGDLFDFWFEYKTVVPRGFVRVLGKLAELRDKGIPIYFFVGNHDLWMFDYFEQELDIPVFYRPIIKQIHGKTFLIGHGDGLGPGDTKYKLMKKVFTNPICQWLFSWVHPNIAMGIAQAMSQRSRRANGHADAVFLGEEKEWLVQYARRKLEQQAIDFFIFGHRHLPLHIPLSPNSQYINLGDWIKYYTYATYNPTTQSVDLHYFKTPQF